MFINNLSWTVKNCIKKHGCTVIWTRHIVGSGDKWVNLPNRKLPLHYASSVSLSVEGKLSSLNLSMLREDLIISNLIGKDGDQIMDNYSINDIKSLPSIVKSPMFAAKKKKKGREARQAEKDDDKEDEDDDDDADDEDDDILPVDYVDLDIETGNLRLDAVMKTALPMARKRIEEVHAEDKIRLNGERVLKRSVDVSEGDVIDCIQGRNRENSKLLDIRRVKLLSVPEYKTAKDRVKFKIRRWPSLTIENYPIHPFESMVYRDDEDPRTK